MKKILTIGSALLVLSTPAFASKARLQALGEDKDGSLYISDYRNLYINPSELNSMGNMAVFEYGQAGFTLQGASLDRDEQTKAEGGVLYSLSNGLKVGAILGDESDVGALTRILSSNVYNQNNVGAQFMQTADNVIDLFVAGSASVNWGANLLYSSSKNEQGGGVGSAAKHDQHAYAARFGASSGSWTAHGLLALGSESNGSDLVFAPKYKGNLGFRVGGGYDLNSENKAFGLYESYSWKQSNTQDAEREGSFKKMIVGLGHTKKVSDSSKFFAKAQVETVAIKLAEVGAMKEAKVDRFAAPITVGFEHSATEWLTLRGSVVQNLIGTVEDSGLTENFGNFVGPTNHTGKLIRYLANQRYGSSLNGNGGKKTLANSTTVNAGATFVLGKVSVDGLVGLSQTGSTSDGAGNNTNTVSKVGVLSFDQLQTRVGVSYNF